MLEKRLEETMAEEKAPGGDQNPTGTEYHSPPGSSWEGNDWHKDWIGANQFGVADRKEHINDSVRPETVSHVEPVVTSVQVQGQSGGVMSKGVGGQPAFPHFENMGR
jgi:hypothetical protein